jgi:hypothetical protein
MEKLRSLVPKIIKVATTIHVCRRVSLVFGYLELKLNSMVGLQMRDNKVAVPEDKVRDSLLEVKQEMYGSCGGGRRVVGPSYPPPWMTPINAKLHGIDGSQYLTMD